MKQLTTRANRPLPHPQTLCSVLEHPPLHHPPPLSMEVTVYSIEDGKRLGLDYGLEGAGVGGWWGRLRGLPASTSSWSLWQQREAQHGKSGFASAQQGLPNLQKGVSRHRWRRQ